MSLAVLFVIIGIFLACISAIIESRARFKALRDIPGPLLAKLSSLWLFWQSRMGIKYKTVDELHRTLGTFVRIQPGHVSVSDPHAIPLIYGHQQGLHKSSFYDAFVSVHRGLFSTRDKSDHSRKRRLISHAFSAQSISQFEPFITANLDLLCMQWDAISISTTERCVDALRWTNFLSFDVIGDLAFGASFDMLKSGQDLVEVGLGHNSVKISAIDALNTRGDLNAVMSCYPHLKPYAKYFPDPFFWRGASGVAQVINIGHARVTARLHDPEGKQRKDILGRLMEGLDATGQPLGYEELVGEALTQLVAGSDTMSNTTCALIYHVLKNPGVKHRLQQELDGATLAGLLPKFGDIKELAYLRAVVNETLRVHSTNASGLPREVPEGPGLTIGGRYFPAGTVLSVPAYTMHHAESIWGADAHVFNPERWFRPMTAEQKLSFIPFSTGPRACIGRNVAEMQMALTVARLFGRYEMELLSSELQTREGFLRKPLACWIRLGRRIPSA